MTDAKTNLIREFQMDLLKYFEPDSIKLISDVLLNSLDNYNVSIAEKHLAVVESDTDNAIKLFLATKRIEGRTEATLHRYSYEICRMLNMIQRPINEIDVLMLRRYLAYRGTNGSSINSVAGLRSIICSLFGWLHREGLIPNNPAAQLGAVKKRINVELPYTNSDIELMRTTCKSLRDRALIEIMLSTGCRINEVTSLNITDLDLKNLECVVSGKGNKERKVYLTEACAVHMTRYLKSRTDDSEALFVGKGSCRIGNNAVRMMLKRLGKRAGVTNVHPHRFRKTVATSLIRKGMPVQDVGRLLGHAKLDTTMGYVHIDDDSVKFKHSQMAA